MVDQPVPQRPSPGSPTLEGSPREGRGGLGPLGLLVGGLSLGLTSIVRVLDRAAAVGEQQPTTAVAERPDVQASQPTSGHLGENGAASVGHPVPPGEARSAPAVAGEAAGSGLLAASSSESEQSIDLIRAGLVGLILESEKQATRGVTAVNRGIRATAELVPGSGLPGSRRVRNALTREATKMEARGLAEIERLAAIGLAEEQQASKAMEAAVRELAEKMVDEAVSLAVERIASSPEIRQVIRSESAGLVEDFLDQVRAVCAHADEVGERGARRLFRRGKPRPEASAGPQELQAVGISKDRPSEVASATVASMDPSPVADARAATFGPPAGFVSRAVALLVDALFVTVIGAVGGFMLRATLAAFHPGIFGDHLVAVPVLSGAGLFILYFLFCWTVFGRTIGMAFMGLKVLTLGGTRVSFPRAVLRYIGYLISAAFVFVGFLWVLIDNRRLGWLDHIARTQVLSVPRTLGRRSSGWRRQGEAKPL